MNQEGLSIYRGALTVHKERLSIAVSIIHKTVMNNVVGYHLSLGGICRKMTLVVCM